MERFNPDGMHSLRRRLKLVTVRLPIVGLQLLIAPAGVLVYAIAFGVLMALVAHFFGQGTGSHFMVVASVAGLDAAIFTLVWMTLSRSLSKDLADDREGAVQCFLDPDIDAAAKNAVYNNFLDNYVKWDIGLRLALSLQVAACLTVMLVFWREFTFGQIQYVMGQSSALIGNDQTPFNQERYTAFDVIWFMLDLTLRGAVFDIMDHFDIRIAQLKMNPSNFTVKMICFLYRTYVSFVLIALLVKLLRLPLKEELVGATIAEWHAASEAEKHSTR
jgi:hypothetical protein